MEESIKAEKSKKIEDWEIDGWVRDLERAEEIKNDPAKMKLVQPRLKKKIKSISDLKNLLKEKMTSDEMEEGE